MRIALLATAFFASLPGSTALPAVEPALWIASWAASQQIPEPRNALSPADLTDATLRQIVHLSAGGATLRIHLSNAFGTAALHVGAAHIARPLSPNSPRIEPGSDRPLSFSGEPDILIPPGADYISDPVTFPAAPLSNLAISLYFEQSPTQQTSHPGSRATSYLAHGNLTDAPDLPKAKRVDHWYQIAAVDVAASPQSATIVVLGDSITDGHGATTNGNDRWPDVLAERLQSSPATRHLSVVNEGIGGNHLLTDGNGPNTLARFDRDVLAPSRARYLIVLEGVNDLGALDREGAASAGRHKALIHSLIAAYCQIISRAHAHGLSVIGATLLPYVGSNYYHPSPPDEADRQALNQWIRSSKTFDAVVDFDALTADPAHLDRLLPAYDSGDHLHPSPAGYQAMGNAIPLSLFRTAQ